VRLILFLGKIHSPIHPSCVYKSRVPPSPLAVAYFVLAHFSCLIMKSSSLFFAALLGLGVSSAASAQTTVPGTIGTPGTMTTAPGTVPGQVGATSGTVPNASVPGSTLPAGTTAPIGTAPSTIYTPGSTPGTLNGMSTGTNAGTLNSTQPVPTDAVPANRSTHRTTTGRGTTTTRP
jgi:hypothetical protein